MENEQFISQFPSIKETQVLTDEMMSEIESGDCTKCTTSCKKKTTGSGTTIDPTLPKKL